MTASDSTHSVLQAALAYQARDWAVFPVKGKRPATRRGVHDASTEERLARIWFERHPDRGVALATGEPSGVWVLDVDGEEGERSFLALQEEHGSIPGTVTSRTGGAGHHLLFKMPPGRDVRNSASRVGCSIDVRGTGGYIVLPPSGHVSDRRYAWFPGRGPDDLPLATAPGWLLDLVAPPLAVQEPAPVPNAPRGNRYVRAAIEAECNELARTPEGSRNDRLNVAAFNLARFVVAGEADAFQVARALAHAAAQAGLREREIARTLESAFGARGAV